MKTNYLQYDSSQIKEVIYRALLDDGRYTEYLYPETKLAAFVDVLAAAFETQMFTANNGIADGSFSTSQVFGNMAGIVKLIDYHIKGMRPSTVPVTIYPTAGQALTLSNGGKTLKFTIPMTATYYDTGTGKSWSPIQEYTVGENIPAEGVSMMFIAGSWTVPTLSWLTNGSPSQVLQLSEIDITTIGWPYVKVYVNGTEWNVVYDKSIKRHILSNPDDMNTVELFIDEDGMYSLKFGDGTYGNIPSSGSKVTVEYLESADGDTVSINANRMSSLLSSIGSIVQQFNTNITESDWTYILGVLSANNRAKSTYGTALETTDEIRESAPSAMYATDKLVTTTDYKNYVMSRFGSLVSDTAVQNNFEFAANFYSWLDNYGLLDWDVRKYGYRNFGSNDSGNVYIWVAGTAPSTDLTVISSALAPIAAEGQNPVVLNGVEQFIQFGYLTSGFSSAVTTAEKLAYMSTGNNFKITIMKKKSAAISDTTIKNLVASTIAAYMSSNTGIFGSTISAADLVAQIKVSVPSVSDIRMRETSQTSAPTMPLTFFTWNTEYVNGLNFAFNTNSVTAETFMYYSFINTLASMLEVRIAG